MKTRLLLGSSNDFTVKLDGKEIAAGKGASKSVAPDQNGFDVVLTKGPHKLTIEVKEASGVVFARFLDPDRKLRYPDTGEKK